MWDQIPAKGSNRRPAQSDPYPPAANTSASFLPRIKLCAEYSAHKSPRNSFAEHDRQFPATAAPPACLFPPAVLQSVPARPWSLRVVARAPERAPDTFHTRQKSPPPTRPPRSPSWHCSVNIPSQNDVSNPQSSTVRYHSSSPPPATYTDAPYTPQPKAARPGFLHFANPRWCAARSPPLRARSRFSSDRNSNFESGPLQYQKSIPAPAVETSLDKPSHSLWCMRCSIRRSLPLPYRDL